MAASGAGGEITVAIDVTDATFEAEILERSQHVPVVVDLWAAVRLPRTLGPILEKLVAERAGEVVLAKIDETQTRGEAATFQVQSIPAVYALRNRRVVSSFIGSQPETVVRTWLSEVAPAPTEVDKLVDAGDEASLRQALARHWSLPTTAYRFPAAYLLIDQGTDEARTEALTFLSRIPESADVRRLRPWPCRRGGRGRGCDHDEAGCPAGPGQAGPRSKAGSTSEPCRALGRPR